MILPVAFLIGAVFGWVRAGARGGDRLDKLQYAAVHGIIFVLVALVATIVAQRFGIF